MLVMRNTTTVPTVQCSFDLRGMRLERMTRKPALVEGKYDHRIPPVDSSNATVKYIAITPLCVSSPSLSIVLTTA